VICYKPITILDGSAIGRIEVGCGSCLACRINKRRLWTGRIMLEAAQHEAKCFVTLTYDDDHLPDDKSLNHKHAQLWLKKLRHRVGKVRFFFGGRVW